MRFPQHPRSRSRAIDPFLRPLTTWRAYYLVCVVVLVLLVARLNPRSRDPSFFSNLPSPLDKPHPIDDLVARADAEFKRVYAKQTHSLEDAAAAYRARRRRHPPPHFDKWVKYANDKDAIIVEDFFDRIYDDLNPFWAVPPAHLREAPLYAEHRISIRDGNLTMKEPKHFWMPLWADMVGSLPDLPDLDLIINTLDESRVLVPWKDIDALVTKAAARQHTNPPANYSIVTEFSKLPDPETPAASSSTYVQVDYHHGPYWNLYRPTCHPESPGAAAELETDLAAPLDFPQTHPAGSHHGYVANWTLSKDPCEYPEMRNMHGAFIDPLSMSTTFTLHPIFGGSKLPGNNEILLPSPMYWEEGKAFGGGANHGGPWRSKRNALVWRGTASGGRVFNTTWHRFQRHRFLSLTNATQVAAVEAHAPLADPPNFALPDPQQYHVPAMARHGLAHWLRSLTDTAFTNLGSCGKCDFLTRLYEPTERTPMFEQYAFKYLPDIDGNSFSGRYRSFLQSSSLPLKATLYAEWHDSRLIAWRHFVPLASSYVDFYGVLAYFFGWAGHGHAPWWHRERPHDDVAERIATQGMEWAQRVLRKDDMQVYVYRLLLEYARVVDDRREDMGWVADL